MVKKIMKILIVFLGLITIYLVACGTGAGALGGTTWILELYGEVGNLQAVLGDTEIIVLFDSAEGKVSGSAGCNNYFASYQLEGDQLSIPGPIAATEMYCMEPEGIMGQEQEYLTALQLAEGYKIEDGKLRINCGQQVLIFSRK